MTDYMLVFPTEADATAVLYTSSTDDDGNVTLTPNYFAIDTLGILYQKAPEPTLSAPVTETLETPTEPVKEMSTDTLETPTKALSEPVTEPVTDTLETPTKALSEPVTAPLETPTEPVTEMLSEPAIAPITEQYTPTPIPGWHVNVRTPEAPELDAYRVDPYPTTPRRVWA